jgi:endonuclease G
MTPALNSGAWQVLEDLGRSAADMYGTVHIMAGPAFVPEREGDESLDVAVIGQGEVGVPTHFFRIMARRAFGRVEVISFLVPNYDERTSDVSGYVVPVRWIEEVTGLRFFAGLPRDELNEAATLSGGGAWFPGAGSESVSHEAVRS